MYHILPFSVEFNSAELRKLSPIGRSLRTMSQRDMDQLTTKFNCVYYLFKRERPFVDYPELLKLHQKNKGPEIGTSYKTDRAAADFSQSIADTYIRNLLRTCQKLNIPLS